MSENLVSIIVPTFNEEKDIERTLEALRKLTYRRKEILFVDDGSLDRTFEVARRHSNGLPIRFLKHPANRGAAAARNTGIRAAEGEILILLNADTLLPPDFIERILLHYENGADYVLVQSKVANTDSPYARFIQAQADNQYGNQERIEWTEGFSCRREAAFRVGLFPEEILGCGGEDIVFANRLSRKYRKKIDSTIVVLHQAASNFKEFWAQQVGRGINSSRTRYYGLREPQALLVLKTFGKTLFSFLRILFLFPIFIEAFGYARFSPRRSQDLLPFFLIRIVQIAGHILGEWCGTGTILKNSKGKQR